MKLKITVLITCIFMFVLWSCAPRPTVVPVKLKGAPGPEERLFLNAEKLVQQGAYEDALALYEEYLSAYPDRPAAEAALMNMGALYSAMGSTSEARHTYQRLISNYPRSSFYEDARVQIIRLLYDEGKYGELIKKAKAIPKGSLSQENTLRIHTLVGDAYMATDFPADAVYFYLKAYALAKGHEKDVVNEKLVSAVARLRSTDMTALLNLLKKKPTDTCLMYPLGRVLHTMDKDGDAVTVLTEYLNQCPGDKNAYDARKIIDVINQRTAVLELDTIGCALPLSGSYKIYGDKALKGIELALARFSADSTYAKINIVVRDTGSEPDQVVGAIRELATERAAAIIGPLVEAKDAAMEAQDMGIPIVALTQKDDVAVQGDFVFRNFLSPSMQVQAIVSYAMNTLQLKKFAILYPDEHYGSVFMNLFWDAVMDTGGRIVGIESYDVAQADFTDPVKKLVGLYYDVPGRKKNPETEELEPIIDFDAIFIPDAPEKIALIMPQLAYYDVENVYVFGTNLWHSQKLIDLAERYVQGAITVDGFFAESESKEVKAFVKLFEKTYGETPGFIEAVAYDTAMMLFTLISQSDIRSRSELMFALKKLENYKGVTGMISFDENGDVKKKFPLLQIKGTEFVQIIN